MVSPVLLEGRRPGEFMVSEANNARSRSVGVIKNAGGAELLMPAGLVLGVLAADGSYAPYTNAAALGQEKAVAILWDNIRIPAAGQVRATLIARDAEVNGLELMYDALVDAPGKLAAAVDLALVGIVVRDAIPT